MTQDLSFPRRHARSQRFTLGRPRSFTVAPSGDRVLFLRSDAGDDPVHHLWSLDVSTGQETRLVDARDLGEDLAALTAAERARRERAREGGAGIVTYDTDREVQRVAFVAGSDVWHVEATGGVPVRLDADGPAYDARLSPDGTRVAAVVDGGLHVGEVGDRLHPLVGEDDVTWGVADFVAAEEMQRQRGHWWSPQGDRLLVCRVDESDVPVWTIADPSRPDQPATEHRYPAAGTTNPDVSLWLVHLDGTRTPVRWDRETFPYLAVVRWDDDGPPLLLVQRRDQRVAQVLTVADDGDTSVLHEENDDAWVEIVPGAPTWAGERLVWVVDLPDHGPHGSRALHVAGNVVTPGGVQVRRIVRTTESEVWFTGSGDDPTQVHLFRYDIGQADLTRVTSEPGVHDAVIGGSTRVVVSATLEQLGTAVVATGDAEPRRVAGESLDPGLVPRVNLLTLGERGLRGALLRPDGDGPWPVLLDPYGGPHAQRVVQSQGAFLTSAWFSSQGFAVLVVDGRGTPGRGPVWERAVAGDLAGPTLSDQVDGLHAAAEIDPRLDLDRVAIRGWSFGGYLAALACLRRPDVFRAGIVGAPVTDWRLYDTHYTERYLGHPDEAADAYRRSGVIDGTDLVDPAPWPDRGPADLLVIHGLADDNVVAAHSIRLSSALLAAGHPHAFLPLSGVTHMTPQEVVAENLLLLQRDFLRRALGG